MIHLFRFLKLILSDVFTLFIDLILLNLRSFESFRGGISIPPAALANGLVPDDRTDALENVTRTIGNLLDGYDIRLRPNFGGECIRLHSNFLSPELI